MKTRSVDDIKSIVLHCSDSGFGDFKLIDLWHRDRGWDMCGYHKIILNGYTKDSHTYNESNDGKVQDGRPIENWGSHCLGRNHDSIGICLIGIDEFSPAQLSTLLDLLEDLCIEHEIYPESIYGHYEFSNKSCPNFDVQSIRELMEDRL
jgi:hypothetical protein